MEFYFEPNDVSTMDEHAIALFSSDSTRTAIAKKDALHHDGFRLSSSGNETLNACYVFVDNWIPFVGVDISFDIEMIRLGSMDMITLQHGGYIRVLQNSIGMNLVSESGEFSADVSCEWDLQGHNIIRIHGESNGVTFEVGEFSQHVEVPFDLMRDPKIIGLFGNIINTEFKVSSITVKEQGTP